jgi:hypothetical protein
VLALTGAIIQQRPYHTIEMTIRAPQAISVMVNDKPAVKRGDQWVCPYEFWRLEEWQSALVMVTTPEGTLTNVSRYAFGSVMPRQASDDEGKHVVAAGVEILPADVTLVPAPSSPFQRMYVKIRAINSQVLYFYAIVIAILAYIIVSLLGRQVFDMDRMLHRGKYAIQSDVAVGDKPELPVLGWRALIGLTPEFTRSDRFLYFLTMLWSLGWIAVFLIQLAINLIHVQSDSWWLNYWMYYFYIQLGVGLIATVWIGIGGVRDMISMFKTLATLKRNDADDGRVVNHHNAGEETRP